MRAAARRLLLGAAPLGLVALFSLLPLFVALAPAFGAGSAPPLGENLAALWNSDYHRNRILFTYQQALLSTGLTLLAGLPLAYAFAFHDFPGKRALRALVTVPFVLPALVVALALQASFGAGGPLARLWGVDLLDRIGPLGAILAAHVYYDLSLVVRIVGAAWERVPVPVMEAARTLGASPLALVRRVLLPLAMPAILGTTALVFLFTASSFAIILLLAAPRAGTIETLIASEVLTILPHPGLAGALGLLQLLTTLGALTLYLWLQRRATARLPPRDEPERPRLRAAGRAAVYAAVALVSAPTLLLLDAAVRQGPSVNFVGFRHLVSGAYPLGAYGIGQVLSNSALFAAATVLLATALALVAVYAFRGASTRYHFLEASLLSPLGTSAVLIGFGFLVAFDGAPLWDLRAHPVRILLAHVLIAFPFLTRILTPALSALHPSLAEAARTLGARPAQVVLRVELPLLRPALQVAAVYAAAASLGEFGATLFLRRPETTTIPLAIYDALARPGLAYRSQAYALCVLLVLVSGLGFWALEARRPRWARGEFA